MKININISFKTWRNWFVSATCTLALALLVTVNNQTVELSLLVLILALNFLASVLVGLRKY